MKNRMTIKTDEQLQSCINSNIDVEVWIAGTLDCLSKITALNDDVVVVKDGKYFRSNYVLRIKGSNLRIVSKS